MNKNVVRSIRYNTFVRREKRLVSENERANQKFHAVIVREVPGRVGMSLDAAENKDLPGKCGVFVHELESERENG